MGSLNKGIGQRQKEKSKILRIHLPRSNPNIKIDLDAELDDGWHIASCITFIEPSGTNSGDTAILYTLVKPKRNT
jgi:hypothetical protein